MAPEKSISYDEHVKKENIFRNFFKFAAQPVMVLNHRTFKVLDANYKALEFFKLSMTEMKKKYIYNLAPEEDRDDLKVQFEMHKSKSTFNMKFAIECEEEMKTCDVSIMDVSIPKLDVFFAFFDVTGSDNNEFVTKIKAQNKNFAIQTKKMMEINRKIIHSYENVKTQYQELLNYQEDNIKAERTRTIGEIMEVLQDKINKPMNRILDDLIKIQDSEKKLDSSVVKRLKLIEESAENVLRLVARIAEVKDIKKMRYIELGNS